MNVEPTLQKPWDWRAAMQFISGGTGAGLLFFTALFSFREPDWLIATGLPALSMIALGLFFVWLKLGRKIRPLYVFLNPRTSWMSREAGFSVALVILCLSGILFRSPGVVFIGSLFGLGYLFSQAQILKSARGIPAWREPRIVPLMMLTGLAEGASVLVISTSLLADAPAWLIFALLFLVTSRWYAWTVYYVSLKRPGAAPILTVDALDYLRRILNPVGHALPVAGLAAALVYSPDFQLAGALAGLFVLIGGWVLKFNLMTRVAYNQGFAIAHTPARAPGYGGGSVKPGWTGTGSGERTIEERPSGDFAHAMEPAELD